MSSLMTVVTLSIAAMLLAWNWQKNHVNAGIGRRTRFRDARRKV